MKGERIVAMEVREAWEKFRSSGLLWLVNGLLHNFGYVIAYRYDTDDNLTAVYPMKVNHSSFTESLNREGQVNLSKYLDGIGTKGNE